ncbi:hypothetical protein [Nesterenkonia aerolata]|uniref:Uncharacterized protein n=1 Tax=Nesterenkonia aerolata TaxID=3074079 RepID=A0ABU2DRP3_9MICC|nr:hypothetical protein [Nesterenkonia sp. LY-0111]MDR8019086.1 hypothetical protein [Nesterenkonia sp. LY-0111]
MTQAHDPFSEHADISCQRRRLLTQRLLRGEGAVEVTAYRAGQTLSSAVRGISGTGQIVVAYVPTLADSLSGFLMDDDVEVRLDITQDAADLLLPLRTASVHLLGTLRWCRDAAEAASLDLRGRVAELVADVGPRVQVGVVETDRVLLHDCTGVTAFCRHTLPLVPESDESSHELSALVDAVQATAPEVLADLADAVEMGLLPGTVTPLNLETPAGMQLAPVHIADVDEWGVTLLRVRGEATASVHIRLAGWTPAGDAGPREAWQRIVTAMPVEAAAHL